MLYLSLSIIQLFNRILHDISHGYNHFRKLQRNKIRLNSVIWKKATANFAMHQFQPN